MTIDIRHWGIDPANPNMVIDGCNVVDIAETYGTPIFVVNERRLRENCTRAKAALEAFYPKSFCFFSYKTNLIPGVLKIIKEEGIGSEVISELEYDIARSIGMSPDKIIFDGIYKPQGLVEKLVREGIKLINIDDENEIEVINNFGKKYNRRIEIGVRINSSAGWGENPFGVEQNKVIPVFKKIMDSDNLLPSGLLLHSSSHAINAADYLRKIEILLRLCEKLKDALGIEIKYADIGGGYGSASVRKMGNVEQLLNLLVGIELKPPRLQDYVPFEKTIETLAKRIKEICERKRIMPPYLHIEPGTLIVEDAQLLLTRVINIKRVGRRPVIVTDAGRINMAHPLKYEYHEMFVANRIGDPPCKTYRVFGRLCSPSDWLYRKKRLPDVMVGDVLAIMDTGAYFNSFSNSFSFPRPAIVSVLDGEVKLLREAENFSYITFLDRV